jgi:hypothetical protein
LSGEATPRPQDPLALERAFGERARCNACGVEVDRYRVIALFLHDLAVVRAYCAACYPTACDGEYHAGGDGLLLDYAAFAQRFGAPGPPPPPPSPVDRRLGTLIRDGRLTRLVPPSEALARRSRVTPYRVHAEFAFGEQRCAAELVMSADGELLSIEGDPEACRHVTAMLGAAAPADQGRRPRAERRSSTA